MLFWWSSALASLMRSTLFWRMMMCSSFMISTAARCSDVCGCGHVSLPATRRRAASMTAAPLSIVAIRMSWPGQSTKETWRTRRMRPPQPGRSHGGLSSFEDGYER
jgi:hypothetical protein